MEEIAILVAALVLAACAVVATVAPLLGYSDTGRLFFQIGTFGLIGAFICFGIVYALRRD